MRKNTTEPTEPQASKPAEVPKVKKTGASVRNWRPLMIMGAIMFLAAFVRVAFSFSVSAGSDFALSGGTDASNNLRFIESIVEYKKIRFTDNWLNYPEGSLIVIPVLFDAVMAAVAMLFNVFMDDPVKASSLALAVSGPLFGVLACIPMYFVGKEMFSSKLAGFAAAGFLALCPIFVQESVFSNGTGMSFAAFLFLFGIYFLIKALKGLQGDAVSAYKTSAFAGIFIAAAMASWIDLRQVAIPIVVVMIAQTLIDRFKGRDPRPAATVYSMVLAIGFILPCVGYTIVGYFSALVSGTFIFIALAIGFAMAYSWTYKKPWILTLPICAGVCLLIMLVLAIVSPSLYGCIVSGNQFYDPAVVDMMGRQYLSLSQLTSYYGVVTYWFVFLVCLYMLFRFLRNSGSHLYVFTLVWLFTVTLTLGHDAMQAAFAAPVFALGFAVMVKVVLEHVSFKSYFSGIKTGAGAKTKVKRVFSPVPLLAILIAVFLVAGPNMMQVVDAGISSNDVEDYNDQISDVTGNDQFGTLGYYVKTDDTWTVRDALSSVKGGHGAVATWMSYSDDVKIYANMKSYTDTYGHGTDVASNILLSNGGNGESAAAVLITAIMNKGTTDDTRAKLTNAGFSAADVDLIFGTIDSVDYKPAGGDKSVKELVISNYEKYGAVSEDISDKNVKYLYLENYIAANYHSADINAAYDSFGMRAPYIMVTGDMMPFFVGYSNVFDQMAILNGYTVNTNDGSVSKYMSYSYTGYYYGVYDPTSALYDSMLYRAYIGMTPEEAGYAQSAFPNSLYTYLTALSAADASVQMHPGYGLSNYEVAYWHVKYNPSNNATADSDGWKDMDAKEAIALQKANGGLINYISGSPVILKYVPGSAETTVSGTVKDSGGNDLADVRVVAVDSEGVVHATTHTSADGTFKIYVPDKANSTLVYYYGGGISSSGGTIVAVKAATENPNVNGVITTVNAGLTVGGVSVLDGTTLLYDIKIENTDAETSEEFTAGTEVPGGKFIIGLGNQTITVTEDGKTVASGTFNVNKDLIDIDIPVETYDYTLVMKDIYGATLPAGVHVHLDGAAAFNGVTDAKGSVSFSGVPKGSYTVSADTYYIPNATFTISSSTSNDITVNAMATVTIAAPADGVTVFVYGDGYSASQIAPSASFTMDLPRSTVSNTTYTIYALYDGHIYSNTAVLSSGAVSVTLDVKDMATVTGSLKNSDGDAVSGTVYFVTDAGEKYKYTATKDDGYKAYVPVGDLTVYATDSTDAYFGTMSFAAGTNADKDISMSDADKESSTISWSGVKHPFMMASATISGKVLPLMADKSGAYSFYLPRGTAATVDVAESAVFKTIHDTVDDSHTSDKSLKGTLELKAAIELTVTNDLSVSGDAELYIGGTTKDVSEWATEKFSVDSRTEYIRLGKSTDAVYRGVTHYFNPEELAGATSIGLSELLNWATVDDITYYTITVSDKTSDYTVKVYYGEGNKNSISVSNTNVTRVALISESTTYRIEIVNKDKTMFFTDTYPAASASYSVADCVPAASVSGYIGAKVNTDIRFTNSGDDTYASVSNGNYSVVLKKGEPYNVTVAATVSGTSYVVNATGVVFSETTQTRNFVCDSEAETFEVNAGTAVTTDGKVSKAQFTIAAGTFTNTTDKPETFTFSVGSGWQSYTFSTAMGSKAVSKVTLDAGASNEDILFVGYFNSALYTYNSEELSISIKGSTDSTAARFTGYGGTGGLVLVNKSADVIGDNTYEYRYSLVNTGTSEAQVTIDRSAFSVPAGWVMYYQLTDALGTSTHEPVDTETLSPGTTTFSVVLMPESTSTDVPGGKLSFTSANGIGTSTPEKVSISEGKADSEATVSSAEVSVTDISASGRDVVNDKGKVPVIVWVMIAAMALLIILIFWMASKRGVFARKK